MTPPEPTRLTRAETARLNGAKSRGPRTPEGKRRSARNALKHGLIAATFTILPGEDGAAFDELEARLAARYRPACEVAAHLVQRLASVMWRQYRADRLEAEVLALPADRGGGGRERNAERTRAPPARRCGTAERTRAARGRGVRGHEHGGNAERT
jgi:hypothetical protein